MLLLWGLTGQGLCRHSESEPGGHKQTKGEFNEKHHLIVTLPAEMRKLSHAIIKDAITVRVMLCDIQTRLLLD